MPKNNQSPNDESLNSGVKDAADELEQHIKVLQAKLQVLQKKGRFDSHDLSEMTAISGEIEHKTAIIDRLYQRKGIVYSLAVKMPLKILNVGSLSDSQRFMRDSFRGVTSPMCVMCNKGILMHNTTQVAQEGQVRWFCSNPECSFSVWAAPAHKDLLMLDVRQKLDADIKQVGQNRWGELSENEKEKLIEGHLSKAKMLRWVAVFLLLLTIFEAVMQFWWALTMIIPVLLLAFVLSIKWGYRAWQIKTGNVFLPNSMFVDWLKTAESYYTVDWVDQKNSKEGGGHD